MPRNPPSVFFFLASFLNDLLTLFIDQSDSSGDFYDIILSLFETISSVVPNAKDFF